VAYPEWANKPFNFGDFSRAARFANSLTNGKVLSHTQSTAHGFKYVTYTVRPSPRTEQGMYNMKNPATTRAKSAGFVIPSNNEWVKAAYYDPKHGGTDSYCAYPTGPFKQPNIAVLNPSNGNVENASDQPLATYNPNDPNSSSDTPGGSSCGNRPQAAEAARLEGQVSGIGRAGRQRPGKRVGEVDWPEGGRCLAVFAVGDERVGPVSLIDHIGGQRLKVVGAPQPERGGRIEGDIQQGLVELALGQLSRGTPGICWFPDPP
jgi:hypothetical protein